MENKDTTIEPEYALLGAKVGAFSIEKLNNSFKYIVEEDKKKIVVCHNLHSIYLINKHPETKPFWGKAHITYIDSVPLLWWGRFLGYPLKNKNRVTFFDWIDPFLKTANHNRWKIFYLGSKPGTADKAVGILNKRYDHIQFKTAHGYFNTEPSSDENKKIINQINAFETDILMVGMGQPRQEKWIAENIEQIKANVLWGCGAGFDFITGEQKVPPRFLAKVGLDWFYRFLCDPKRLFKRYFIEPLSLIPVFFNDFKQ